MKKIKITLLVFITVIAVQGLLANGSGNSGSGNISGDRVLLNGIASSPLDVKETEGLLLMREEEKLARDVYLALYDKTGQKTFSNIARSEQQHMDSVKALLDRYVLEDPVKNDQRGVFTNPEMQKLYEELTRAENLIDALKTGGLIEDLDIYDLKRLIAATDNEDLKLIYGNLLKGSENHMRAFNRQLERNGGGSYKAQYLSQQEVNAILAAK